MQLRRAKWLFLTESNRFDWRGIGQVMACNGCHICDPDDIPSMGWQPRSVVGSCSFCPSKAQECGSRVLVVRGRTTPHLVVRFCELCAKQIHNTSARS